MKAKQLLLLSTISLGGLFLASCNVSPTPASESSSSESTSTSGDASSSTPSEDTGYKVTFVPDSHVTVTVFPTQDLTTGGEVTNIAYSRDGDTGALLSDGNGQVNFTLTFEEGYELDSYSIDGNYKNWKVEGTGYRITKIASELSVTITSKEAEEIIPDPDSVTSYTQETSYNEENYSLAVTAVSGEMKVTYSEKKGILKIIALLGDDEASEISLVGSFVGQIHLLSESTSGTTLDLGGVTLYSYSLCPLYVDGEVDISATKSTKNYIYDHRAAVSDDPTTDVSASIYVTGDTKLKGKGELTINSDNNNGVHSKDDLDVKNLTLNINVCDNALKGNDELNIESGTHTIIARKGDTLKTANSGLSSKGNQKGDINISDGTINLYAATDAIDAAYNVNIINGKVNILTDKYSEYSEEVTDVTDSVYYIRNSTTNYKYSIYYYNVDSDNNVTDSKWVNSDSYTTVSGGRSTYYYYDMEKPANFDFLKVYVYSSSQTQGQSSSYTATWSASINESFDTIAISSRGGSMNFSWTNKSQSGGQGGGPGMGPGQEGNTDKGDYSTKGIKADNAINISGGTITVKSYDDAIHANNDNSIESGVTPLGDVNISGGTITLYSNDDGVHADGTLTVSGTANLTVTNAYEGIEGNIIKIEGGSTKVTAKDDGVNALTSITVSGGYLDETVSSSGDVDGIDSNGSYTQTGGVVIARGPNSQMAAALDTDGAVSLSGGTLIVLGAIEKTPSLSGGVSQKTGLSLHSSGSHTVTIDGTSYTFTNAYSYSKTICYSNVEVK